MDTIEVTAYTLWEAMRYLFLLLLITCVPVKAQQVTPNFTTGSMTQTIVTTQVIEEVVETERFGGAVTVWNGDNVKAIDANGADCAITATSAVFAIVDEDLPWELELITRAAGVVETIDADRTITTNSTTNTLSVFSQ